MVQQFTVTKKSKFGLLCMWTTWTLYVCIFTYKIPVDLQNKRKKEMKFLFLGYHKIYFLHKMVKLLILVLV